MPLIGDVRGSGMFFAVELVSDRGSKAPATADTKRVVNGMCERGVLLSRIGLHDNILKIRPPMPFSTAKCRSPGRYARRRARLAMNDDAAAFLAEHAARSRSARSRAGICR